MASTSTSQSGSRKSPRKGRGVQQTESSPSPDEESTEREPLPPPRRQRRRRTSASSGLSMFIQDFENEQDETEAADQNTLLNSDGDIDDSSFADPNETRRILNEMIDTCQELDEKQGFQENEDELIRQQVKQSKLMFETQFTIGNSNASSEEINPERSRRSSSHLDTTLTQTQRSMIVDARPTDMYLTYKHTKICAGLMRRRVQNLGTEESNLSVDSFLNGLKELARTNAVDEEGNIDEKDVDLEVMKFTASSWNTAPYLPLMLGSFDYKEFLGRYDEAPIEKEKKVPKQRRDKQFNADCLVATQEEVNLDRLASQQNPKKLDAAANQFRKSLRKYCFTTNGDLWSFTLNKDSVRDSLNNVFGVAFGIRDGTIELSRAESGLLKIQPCKPPDDQDNMANRRQTIMSMSAGKLREMQKAAQGENALKEIPPPTPSGR